MALTLVLRCGNRESASALGTGTDPCWSPAAEEQPPTMRSSTTATLPERCAGDHRASGRLCRRMAAASPAIADSGSSSRRLRTSISVTTRLAQHVAPAAGSLSA